MLLKFSPNEVLLSVWAHKFAGRIVFIGVGEQQDAINPNKFNRLLQIELLRELAISDHEPERSVEVYFLGQNLSTAEANSLHAASIITMKPIWQGQFDQARYERENPNILWVQKGRVYGTAYGAAKAAGISTTAAYNALTGPAWYKGPEGVNLIRTRQHVNAG